MKSFLKICMCALLLSSHAAWSNSNYTYLGTDLSYSYTEFKEEYGRDIFDTNNDRQYNFFIGHYFSNLFGFEVGYAKNITKNSMSVVPAGTSEFGVPDFTAIASNVYDTAQSAYQYNFNYVPQIQLTKSLSIVAVIGLSYIKTKDNMNLTLFDNAIPTTEEQNDYDVSFKDRKTIPRFGFRVQYLLGSMLGLRASYIWENTDLLTPTATRNINPDQTLQAKLNNSSSVGVGVFLKF